jgi:membrane protein YqaA with SNARE-associated domain
MKYGALAVFFFAVLPLPDEIVWIPIGILRFDIRKAIAACWIGKFLFMLMISFAGYYGIKEILNLF